MSLNNKKKLAEIAKVVCRDLRKILPKQKEFSGKKFVTEDFAVRNFTDSIQFSTTLQERKHFSFADFFCFEEKLIVELDGKYHQYRLKEDEKTNANSESPWIE